MLLEIRNLVVHYGRAQALHDVSLHVNSGEIVTLIGSNGAGKTTALRTISGLVHPSSGEIWFAGERVDRLAPDQVVRRGLCHVPEQRDLFPHMTVLENLMMGAFLQTDRATIQEELDRIFLHFPVLQERRHQQARTLSGGEQQMLAITRALMAKPKLLLLDEPSLGLSPVLIKQIAKVVRGIHARGVPIVLVEQNARLALGLAQRGYVLETGQVVLDGPAEELVKNDLVKRAYLG